MEAPAPAIELNGSPRAFQPPLTVTALLEDLGLKGQPALVELNGTALFPREFTATEFRDGDVVEIIRIVAGG